MLRAYGFNLKTNKQTNKNQALIIPEAIMLAKHCEGHKRIISGSTESVNSGAPNAEKFASSLLQRQAVY